MIKYFLKEVLYAKKIQVGAAPSLSATVKHLVGMNSKKIGGMQNVRDILLKFPTDKLKTYYLQRSLFPT